MADDRTIFICYAGPDRAIAVALHGALRGAGLTPWCDAVDLQPGDRWDEVIPRSMNASAIVVVLVSAAWPEVGAPGVGYYGPEEVAIAIDRSRTVDPRLRIVPVRLDGVSRERMPYGLRRITDIQASRVDLSAVAERLGALIQRPTRPTPTRPEPAAEVKRLTRQKARLAARGAPQPEIDTVVSELLALKRTLRAGGSLTTGDVLADRYVLGQRLGHGGFASVWRAWDERAERLVAVKVLHGRWSRDQSRIDRFDRGARKMAGLRHPHVVEVLDPHAECDGWHFFVMAYLPGGNLHEAITREAEPLSVDEGLRALLDVAEALSEAHARGMVHRDVKPENIVLDAAGRAQLTDFDLVRVADSTGGTATGGMGTFVYAAPEQFDRPQGVGAEADVYGLGMTAVFVLTGARPPMMCKWAPQATAGDLPATAALRALVQHAIAIKPAERPADAGVFAEALRAIIDGGRGRANALVDWSGPLTATDFRPAMLPIPAGVFTMGSPQLETGRDVSETPHRVEISNGFWMTEALVTQDQYAAVMSRNPSRFRGELGDAERPVERVSWFDVVAFCNRLSTHDGLAAAYAVVGDVVIWNREADGYRLPTESEWEYAARAGSTTATPAGDLDVVGSNNAPVLDSIAWYGGNSGSEHSQAYDSSGWAEKQYPHETASTHPVGRKQPNTWGLRDMLGNVWEWTWDWSAAYPAAPTDDAPLADPAGPLTGTNRAIRGGSWRTYARWCRSAYRSERPPGNRDDGVGFRLVRTARAPWP